MNRRATGRALAPFLFLLLTLFEVPALAQTAEQGSAREGAATAARGPEQKALTRSRIAEALLAYDREPPVREVVEAALRTAAADPEKARAMASRARMAGLVPTVRLAVKRGLTRDLSESQTLETDRTDLATDHDLVLEASLTFNLQRLVFDHNEVALAREERALGETRAELVRAVIELYYERRRLQLERDLTTRADLGRAMRISELEALLDAFTGGAFRRMINPLKRSASAKPSGPAPAPSP